MRLDYSGKVVVVTGAGQGNGAAMVRGFAAAGAAVAVVDRNLGNAEAVASNIIADDGKAKAYQADVADAGACAALAAKVAADLGLADVLVNNAGILLRGRLEEIDPLATWQQTLSVNLGGAFNMCIAFLAQLKSRRGCILNVGSIQSFVATPNSVAYTASKGGVAQMTKAMAYEFAENGIRVNAIAPGVIATPMTEATRGDPAKLGALLAHVPMRRYGEAEELIGPALFLCSSAASYVTGTILPVDGGYLAA